jgi:hypothetical protein
MTTENSDSKGKRWTKRIAKGLMILAVAAVVLYAGSRVYWRYSGSNQWELVREGNGAKVYALKEPGTELTQYRGVVRVHSTLNRVVAWLQDPDTCKDARCLDPRTIEQVDEQLQYVSMRFKLPGRFQSREFVMRARFHQIPTTKEVWVEYAAAPEKVPPSDCCFRVTDMNNIWRITPVGNGELEIEYTMNMDWGGYLPDTMSNRVRPIYMLKQLQKLEGYVNRDKYRNAKYAFIQEPEAATAVTENTNAAAISAAVAGKVR